MDKTTILLIVFCVVYSASVIIDNRIKEKRLKLIETRLSELELELELLKNSKKEN